MKPIYGAWKTCINCQGTSGERLNVLPTCPQAQLMLGTFTCTKADCDGSCLHYKRREK